MYGKDPGEDSKVCLIQPYGLNKARLPSLEVERKMNIAIQQFTLRNSDNILKIPKEEGATWNKLILLFGPINLKLFVRGIENNKRPETFRDGLGKYFYIQLRAYI